MVVQGLPVDDTVDVRSLDVAPGFSIRAVDGLRGTPPTEQNQGQKPFHNIVTDVPVLLPEKISNHPDDDPTLGPVLGKFVGTFRYVHSMQTPGPLADMNAVIHCQKMVANKAIEGTGMNTIFRPNNGTFATPPLDDNLLEINLTVETLQFMQSSVLGRVPNRGFDNQEDVFLTGIPYMQTVSDQLNEATGLANLGNKKIDLHFEQGLLMRVPASTSPDTKKNATLSRMGSIPHGTTINLQDFEPKTSIPGKPNIPGSDITPFLIGTKTPQPFFDNMKTMDPLPKRIRTPTNLTEFKKKGTITLQSLQNPNQFLTDFNAKKTIDSHWTFTLKSKHDQLGGGGVTNVAFLVDGVKPQISGSVKGNANATTVECTYWVSTVRYKVVIEPKDYTNEDPILKPTDDVTGVPGAQFQLQIKKKTTQQNTIEVTATQIQYSQNVTLDFGRLSWPHISVATLAPSLPILIPQGHAALQNLK